MPQPRKTAARPTASEASERAIEPLGPDVDVAPFRVTDPRDISRTLQALATNRDPVTVYPALGGAFLSGCIAQVRPQTQQVVVEVGNVPAPTSDAALLVAMPQGIKLQFSARGNWQHQADGCLHWTADLPHEIIHLQRRRFPRRDMPLGPLLRAEFALHGQAYVMGVDDLSIGGVGLRAPMHQASGLMPGQRLRRVRLDLGVGSPLTVDLEICSRRAFRSFLAGKQIHFGCRFVDFAADAVAELQGILDQLDADRRLQATRS